MTDITHAVSAGKPFPLGPSTTNQGINFALVSTSAKSIKLILYLEDSDAPEEINLHAELNKTGDIWHIHVANISSPVEYAYKLTTRDGQESLISDPYSPALTGAERWGMATPRYFHSLFVENEFDWQNDRAPLVPFADTIIYELHTRGFTQHPSSQVSKPGTFMGLVEKIPYLLDLGITAVELLPVTEFDETANPRRNPAGKSLTNYWGYDPISFFAVKSGYCNVNAPGDQLKEFKTFVREFHKAGIEVILDVVFNHSGESAPGGPTYNYRAIDAHIYYMLKQDGKSYLNFSGCGNTMNTNHPIVSDLIIAALRFWAVEMHVDGFRFDLASILTRDQDGHALALPPVVDRISKDPVLNGKKLIAEAWDAGGLYQVGKFPGGNLWAEWNGIYRDDMRRYVKGDPGLAAAAATRIAGSADLYKNSGRKPFHSINFITCHDGFTLWDLVTYNNKYNLENGENNRDGSDLNLSWNCGNEGPADDPDILRLRQRQIKNFFCMLLLSQGTPMLLAGDEFGRTQHGNNNAYCQDNEISWLDWSLLQKNADIYRFVKLLIAFRKSHKILRRHSFFSDAKTHPVEITWHGRILHQPDWSEKSCCLAFHLISETDTSGDIYVISNQGNARKKYQLPSPSHKKSWFLKCDTAKQPPDDIYDDENIKNLNNPDVYIAEGHTTIILESRST